MQTDPIVQCPNYFCQALNAESQSVCQRCQTRIPKRYLWAVGAKHQPGDLIDDRFWVKSPQIVLDTKPGIPPTAIEVPPHLEPYLHLMAERPVIPQPFAVVENVLLLESAPIYPNGARSERGEDLSGQLMPSLAQAWTTSSGFRQIHFLWQLAQLWRGLSVEKVASTLLDPDVLFVDGDTLRILELDFDRAPKLAELGKFWSTWQPQPTIADFFDQVCQNLIHSQITDPDQLMQVLDQAIAAQSQQQSRSIQIATCTDQGPSRQSNEDACYPPSGTRSSDALVIVCDGIGGHEGGEVASNLAIQTIVQQVQVLDSDDPQSGLENAVFAANDAIAEKNDAERRQERQRMGTTVVMGFIRDYEFYLTHVGDSRAYRITRQGCYQVTLDDDVASREARLGYTLYQDALQSPSAGSLVQALGMSSSSYLHPTVQRFILDQDCVYLLCSDGLSDNDRVEECWQTEIVPILNGKADVATVARKLVEIANTRNGHDNVTIGLIHCQTRDSGRSTALRSSAAKPTQMVARSTPPPQVRTDLQSPRSSPVKIVLILLGLFGLAGAIAAVFVPELTSRLFSFRSEAPTSVPASPTPALLEPLNSGMIIQLGSTESNSRLPLLKSPGATNSTGDRVLPPGSVVQILNRQTTTDQTAWVRLKVCTPATGVKAANLVRSGEVGWQRESAITPFTKPDLKPDQLGACTPPAVSEQPKDNVTPAR